MELSRAGIGAIVKIESDGRVGVVLTPDSKSVGLGVIRVFTYDTDPEGKVLRTLAPQLIRQSTHVILLHKFFECKDSLKMIVAYYEKYAKEMGL